MFASSEYVERWLTDIQSRPSKNRPVQLRQQSKRQRSLSPESRIHATPYKRRKRTLDTRGQRPAHRTPHAADKENDSENDEEQQNSRSVSSDLPAKILPRDHVPSSPRSRQVAPQDPSEKRDQHKVAHKEGLKSKHKRSRRNKIGDTLNQEFKAPNVGHERLTLKTTGGPGIFGKGKASALLHTSGLPDLTFSEMAFLTKKRQPDLAPHEKQKQSNASKHKDRAKEISGLFAESPRKAAKPFRTSSEVHQRRYPMGPGEWQVSPAVSSPAKLASGAGLGSASEIRSKLAKQLPRSIENNASANVKQSKQHRVPEIPPTEFACEPATGVGTSCSWSVTSSGPGSKNPSVDRRAFADEVPPESPQQSKLTPTYETSITNSSIDRYTQNLLLRNDGIRRQSHRAPLAPNIFSLDDLKGLARIAEIESRYFELPGMWSQSGISPVQVNASAAYRAQPEVELGTNPDFCQLSEGNATLEPSKLKLPTAIGALPRWPLHLRDYQQYQVLSTTAAPRFSFRVQDEASAIQYDPPPLDHARHHDKPSRISDDHLGHSDGHRHKEQQFHYTHQHQYREPTPFYMLDALDIGASEERHDQSPNDDHEQIYIYQDAAQETFGPAMSILPIGGVLALEDYALDQYETNNNSPEFDVLLDGGYMGDQMDICGQEESGVQGADCDDGQAEMSHEHCFQHSAAQHRLGSGADWVSAWEGQFAPHSFEGREEEFQGFSRPQILY